MPSQRLRYSNFATALLGGQNLTILNQNPNFETGLTPWTPNVATAITQNSSLAYRGLYSMQMACTVAATAVIEADSENTIPVVAGQTYTAQGFFTELTTGTTAVPNGELLLTWLNAGGGAISSINSGSLLQLGIGVWRVATVSGAAPGGAVRAQLSCLGLGAPTLAVGASMLWDFVSIVQGTTAAGVKAATSQASFTCPPHVMLELDTLASNDGSQFNTSTCDFYTGNLVLPQNFLGRAVPTAPQVLLTSPAHVYMGQQLLAVWTGGDVGATAIFTVNGTRVTQYRRGGR